MTRHAVLEAAAALVAERGVIEVSIQDVADRAGVSHRTVYRHFPNRQALMDAGVAWTESRLAGLGAYELPAHSDDVGPLVRRKFRAFDELVPFVLAAFRVDVSRLATRNPSPLDEAATRGARQSARSRIATRSVLGEISGHLPPDIAEAVGAVIHQLGSTRMWFALRQEEGVEGEPSAEAAAWAVETLIAELRAGRGPRAAG
jgi:AcrR family transcriptional regulator